MRASLIILAIALGLTQAAAAQIVIPGTTGPAAGSDGALNVTGYLTIDLSLAEVGEWDAVSPTPGRGIYDPDEWIVVFKYSSVNISYSCSVSFINHPSGAPVVWLVAGDVTLPGKILLNATGDGVPGGFPGSPGGAGAGFGAVGGTQQSAGFGMGGGGFVPGQLRGRGSFGTEGSAPTGGIYGNQRLLPLLGGSGGCGHSNGFGGGAGGGAILIAATGKIELPDPGAGIFANGGYSYYGGSGSGGGIRLIADRVEGIGRLSAIGGDTSAGKGRIRIETLSSLSPNLYCDPEPSRGSLTPGVPAVIVPEATAPSVRVSAVNGQPISDDPSSSLSFPQQEVTLPNIDETTIRVETRHVPLSWHVVIRVTPRSGPDLLLDAVRISGNQSLATWEATLTGVPCGFSMVQARAFQP